MKTKYYVYVIGAIYDIDYENSYIGVTNNLKRRWHGHEKSKYKVGLFIRQHKLQFEKDMRILFEGTAKECFELEAKLRPQPLMGLNEASGGYGGYTKYSQERSKKISLKLTGRKISNTHIEKILSSRRKYFKKDNPNAKTWIILNPDNNEFKIKGNLISFCTEHQISIACLKRYENQIVQPPKYTGMGGFRIKSENSKLLRENTIGWTLKSDQNGRGGV